jgi:hypothetical protein
MATVGVDYGNYLYTLDDGTFMNVRIQKTIGDDAHFGFAAYDSTKGPVRRLYEKHAVSCRHVLCQSATGNRRKLPVGTVGSDVWQGTTTSVSMPIRGSATPEAFPFVYKVGEKVSIGHAPHNL